MIITREQCLHWARMDELLSVTSHSHPASAGCHSDFIFPVNRFNGFIRTSAEENLPFLHTLTLAVGFT